MIQRVNFAYGYAAWLKWYKKFKKTMLDTVRGE